MFKDNEITDLLIVSNGRLGPSAQSYVDAIPQLSHQTYDDLRNSLIDFRSYLAGYKDKFINDDVFHYYVDLKGRMWSSPNTGTPSDARKAGDDLLSLILAEMRNPSLPLVVLGAYGVGKTTLAKKLFLELMGAWERNPAEPIPIYISLDRMMREQSLDGLLGAMFTSTAPSPGYSFDLFCTMNEKGHVVPILDGLDEMRHKLSWDAFQYNLEQISILTSRNPRSVLLGRPSAFMDQQEYDWAIHGKSTRPSVFSLRPRTSYREAFIDPLSPEQIAVVINTFCWWRYPAPSQIARRATAVLADEKDTKIHDLARRPVQLMIAVGPIRWTGIRVS
jgi:hypothetical protein